MKLFLSCRAVFPAILAALVFTGCPRIEPQGMYFTYSVIQHDGVDALVITGYRGRSDVVIPAEIGGLPVRRIGPEAFFSRGLTSVYIPCGVYFINDFSFSFNSLTEVVIPDSVRTIGTYAFRNNHLAKINIPYNVAIGIGVFSGNRLTKVAIPEGTYNIWHGTFSNNQLPKVVIPCGVTEIWGGAFSHNRLKEVCIPNSVTYINESAFGNNLLESVILPTQLSFLSGFNNNLLMDVAIPPTVVHIGSNAFSGNMLESIDLPCGLTRIRARAFSDNLLTSVVIPASVEEHMGLGRDAFYGNPLVSITIEKGGRLLWSPSLIPFNNGFEEAFEASGRLAGTYTRSCAESADWALTKP